MTDWTDEDALRLSVPTSVGFTLETAVDWR